MTLTGLSEKVTATGIATSVTFALKLSTSEESVTDARIGVRAAGIAS